jgi:GntR family transcriptional regulator/MocR family aminotransferase
MARARAAGLGVYPVGPLYAPAPAAALPDTTGLVMGYASLDERAIERGVRTLKEVLDRFSAIRPARGQRTGMAPKSCTQ